MFLKQFLTVLGIVSCLDFLFPVLCFCKISIFLVELLLLLIHLVVLSTGSGSAPTLVPPVLRGLTELFLVVENLAQVSIYGYCPSARSTRRDIGRVFLLGYGLRPISRHFDRTSLVNKGVITSGKQRVIPSRLDNAILPGRVANHSAGLDFSCPLTELAI